MGKIVRRLHTWRDVGPAWRRFQPEWAAYPVIRLSHNETAVICVAEYFGYTREALGESGNWQPCLKNYLQFLSACC
jgi:hypothetical protein